MDIDENIFRESDEKNKQDLAKQFISTARVLYAEDQISELSDQSITKFLTSRQGHTGKGLEALAETLSWRKKFNTQSLFSEDYSMQEQSGKLHFFGKAIDQSAILIFTAQRQEDIKSSDDLEKNLRFVIYSIEKARKEKDFDKITVLIDMNKARYSKNEVKLASVLIPILQKHYPDTLSRCYLFPTNGIFWMTYSASKYFLDAKTIPKIYLRDSAASITEWISRDQFYVRFGGSAIEKHMENSFDSNNEKVLKSNAIIEVEEVFIAPLEYHSV